MNITETFKRALLALIRKEVDEQATAIEHWRSDVRTEGFCETCAYDQQIIWVKFLRENGTWGSWEWVGDMGDLIRRLDAADVTAIVNKQ